MHDYVFVADEHCKETNTEFKPLSGLYGMKRDHADDNSSELDETNEDADDLADLYPGTKHETFTVQCSRHHVHVPQVESASLHLCFQTWNPTKKRVTLTSNLKRTVKKRSRITNLVRMQKNTLKPRRRETQRFL